MVGMVISVLSEKGGVGKTMVTIQLAVEMARQNKRVLAIDTDRGETLLSWWGKADPDRPAGLTVKRMGPEDVRHRVPIQAQKFDYVFIDTPNHVGPVQAAALEVSDLVILPTSPSGSDADRFALTMAMLEKGQRVNPRLKAAVVINLTRKGTVMAREAREKIAVTELLIIKQELGSRLDYVYAYNEGKGVTTYAPGSEAAFEVRSLATEVQQLLGGEN